MRRLDQCFVIVIAATVAACGGGGGPGSDAIDGFPTANLPDTPENARMWAQMGSAPQIYALANTMTGAADLAIQLGATCPTKTESGTRTTYSGGCTDDSGQTWVGSATVDQTATGGTTRYDGFGASGPEDCNGAMVTTSMVWNGTLTASGSPTSGGGSFEVDLAFEGDILDDTTCVTRNGIYAIDYAGTLSGQGDRSEWGGSGRVGSNIDGVADVDTDNEVIDDNICEDEAISGTTTIRAGGHSYTITYDGETDCDMESTVQWSYDGQARGEIDNVSCATGGGSNGVLIVLAVVVGLRIRRPTCGRRAPAPEPRAARERSGRAS